MTIKEKQPDPGTPASWPRFEDIAEPSMVALYTGGGSGTKLFQGFLDGHPEIYMIPGYPLIYFYPHWRQWQRELTQKWDWQTIIEQFCARHASVIDSRLIPGHDGMSELGELGDRYVALDGALFRRFLAHLLEGQVISSRVFLLAVHFAYAFCRGEDLGQKNVLVLHIHTHYYLRRFLEPDFPDMKVLGTTRDPRSNFHGRYYNSLIGVDETKLNPSDAMLLLKRAYLLTTEYFIDAIEELRGLDPERVRLIRHEDLHYKPEKVLRATAQFLGVPDHPAFRSVTFAGHVWKGDKVYGVNVVNKADPRVVSDEWQKRIDPLEWFVFEGLFFHHMNKYGYRPHKYMMDSFWNRLRLLAAIILPSKAERDQFRRYFGAGGIAAFVRTCRDEASGAIPLKDYGFNAYYRHREEYMDIELWRPRWFKLFLFSGRGRVESNPHSGTAVALYSLARFAYVAASLCRYSWAGLTYPAVIVKRWRVSLAGFGRMVRNDNVLPELLE